MTSRYRYAIIGTGIPWKTEGATGFGMANPHYTGFMNTGQADLVSISDVRADHAALFMERHECKPNVYSDYLEMLNREKPDIVSITCWPHLHADMVAAACSAGVRAIHCEKPMASTWGDAKRMKQAADAAGTILTFNHQRRFLDPFQKAKQILDSGEAGALQRMEATCGDMTDWGTHWLDMMFYFNNETPAKWVLGQIDSREEVRIFGALAEQQAVCHFKFENDVRATLYTGFEANVGAAIRLFCAEGVLEIGWDNPSLRMRTAGDADWRVIPTTDGIHGGIAIDRACADLVRALDQPGYKPMLAAENAIHHTEVIFATFESSRRRGRVDLPLTEDDSALITMTKEGLIGAGSGRTAPSAAG
jgi:predicted dehydrogenase